MDYAIGIALALLVAGFATFTGFDRDRAFYPTVLVVIALYYVLFAAMGADQRAVALESVVMMGFAAVAVVGFKGNLWVVAAGLAGHGVFDAVHGYLITNPGVPVWWPAFCLAYDVTAAGAMIWLFRGRPDFAKNPWQTRT
jgi:hypothetical protein